VSGRSHRDGGRHRTAPARVSAGILEEADANLDKTHSALGRIETGTTKADVHLIRSMMDIYDQYEPDLIDLVREANRPGWWQKYNIDEGGYLSTETEASAGAGLQEPGWWPPRVRWLRVAGVARHHGARWSGVSGATVLASAV
jgi:hypothetical protein